MSAAAVVLPRCTVSAVAAVSPVYGCRLLPQDGVGGVGRQSSAAAARLGQTGDPRVRQVRGPPLGGRPAAAGRSHHRRGHAIRPRPRPRPHPGLIRLLRCCPAEQSGEMR